MRIFHTLDMSRGEATWMGKEKKGASPGDRHELDNFDSALIGERL
jgi:hypothetical protein